MGKFDNLTDKQKLQVWEDYLDNIRKKTSYILGESEAEKIKRMKWLEKPGNEEEWFKHYFEDDYQCEAADFQKKGTRRIMDNPEWIEGREHARELAKTTRTMMETMLQILVPTCKSAKNYILMVSNSLENAERLLMPYRAHLTANERIINDYGLQELPGHWSAGEFVTRKGKAFRALGLGQSPRGTKINAVRPDKIIGDDMDTDEACRNPEQVKKNWNWIEDALIPTRSVSKDTQIVFNGNIIASDSIMVRLRKISDHTSQVNIRDKHGKSTWPQKNSEEQIDRILKTKSYASAQKEYFNNPIYEGTVFKEMAYKPARQLNQYSMLVCYTDPSYKDTKTSDYKATVLVGKWKDEFHVIKAFVEQTTTAKMIEWHYEIMKIVGDLPCYYFMEEVFLQDIFLKEFYEAGAKNNKTIPISGDQRVKANKFVRIESLLEPLNRNGKLFLNKKEEDNIGMKRVEEQFKALAPKSRAHDDAPDAVEGAVWVLNTKVAARAVGNTKFYSKQKSKHSY